jgi:hypothetical protein
VEGTYHLARKVLPLKEKEKEKEKYQSCIEHEFHQAPRKIHQMASYGPHPREVIKKPLLKLETLCKGFIKLDKPFLVPGILLDKGVEGGGEENAQGNHNKDQKKHRSTNAHEIGETSTVHPYYQGAEDKGKERSNYKGKDHLLGKMKYSSDCNEGDKNKTNGLKPGRFIHPGSIAKQRK